MMDLLDRWLDHITMYRLLLYYLLVLIGAAMLFGALGYVPYSPMAIAAEAGYLLLACWLINRVFSYVYEAPHNPESSLLTALILALIITPPASTQSFVFLSAAAGLAMASKYILAIRRQHIFNPAAIAVVLTSWGAGQSASWWVGNTWLAPVVLIGGLLVVRKVQRGTMVTTFLATAIVMSVILGAYTISTLQSTVLHSSLLFLGFVMLTEPLTSPSTHRRQIWYAVLVGLLFAPQVHLFHTYSTPEIALVIGNVFAYIISPRLRLMPRLQSKIAWGPSVHDFVFAPGHKFVYKPGQYMEWTLPHERPDNRGVRRYFTLASSPTEDNLRIGVKFYDKGSSFKEALWSVNRRTPIAAGLLGGDFTLPKDTGRKLVFIAGGIGITPYRSMLKYLIDTDEQRIITLLYSERTLADIAYHDVFQEARQRLGTKVVYTVSDPTKTLPQGIRTGQITPQMIQAEVPDYRERLFYISGPQPMVAAIRAGLHSLGVHEHDIKTDFFPGYA
jgi:ferredoxin-NADP reductase/Na+-translocating ferredoxin:NAD+ oxidoreductase RnfD subunit